MAIGGSEIGALGGAAALGGLALLTGGTGAAFLPGALGSMTGGQLAMTGALGGGMLGGMFGGGEKAEGMAPGYSVVNLPTWSWTEGTQRVGAETAATGLQRLQEGVSPWESYFKRMEKARKAGLREATWGRDAERTGTPAAGVLETAGITQLGPGVAAKGMQKLGAEFMSQSRMIDDAIAQAQIDLMNQQEQRYMDYIRTAPMGPPAQVVSWGGMAAQPQASPFAGLAEVAGQFAGSRDMWGRTPTDVIDTTAAMEPWYGAQSPVSRYAARAGAGGPTYSPYAPTVTTPSLPQQAGGHQAYFMNELARPWRQYGQDVRNWWRGIPSDIRGWLGR
jgi:hypothetical protein